jgi:hypothetical protein
MGAKYRLDRLNSIHGVTLDIHVYNCYYHVDMLRVSKDEFNSIVGKITSNDVLRVRGLNGVTLSMLPSLTGRN